MPLSRDAGSGLLLVLLGIWSGVIPFVGPTSAAVSAPGPPPGLVAATADDVLRHLHGAGAVRAGAATAALLDRLGQTLEPL